MKNGLYIAKFFNSDNSDWGTGIVVIREGTINGGDLGYTYQGRFVREEYDMVLQIKVKRWNSECLSIIGDIEDFDLELKDSSSPGASNLKLTGYVDVSPGHQMTLYLERFGDLVD